MTKHDNQNARFFHIRPGSPVTPLSDQEQVLDALKGEGYVWLDFFEPSAEHLIPWVNPLGLHPLAIEDCLDEEQVPKIEDFPNHTFLLMNSYEYTDNNIIIREMNFFVGDHFLLTVRHGEKHQQDLFKLMLDCVKREANNVISGPDFLLHVLLDFIVDEKFEAIESLQDELDDLEEIALKDPTNFNPAALLTLRKHLLSLRKSLFHEREILVRICRLDSPFIGEKVIYHFRDVYDHLAKFYEVIEIYREMISNLMEIYLSMLNNRMTVTANRTNQIVSRLTLINTIFMPLTLLAGIGGMSEWSMMTGPGNWKTAYPLFFLLMAGVAVVNYFILKWFEKRDKKA